jgi:hypothetical protein
MARGRQSYSAADVVASLLSLSAEKTADEQTYPIFATA